MNSNLDMQGYERSCSIHVIFEGTMLGKSLKYKYNIAGRLPPGIEK